MGDALVGEHDSSSPRHDPVQRLNDEHGEQLLDVARAFTGHPDAVSAHAVAIDDNGVDLVIETPDGRETGAHVEFAATTTGARRRLAFRALALRATELIGEDRTV